MHFDAPNASSTDGRNTLPCLCQAGHPERSFSRSMRRVGNEPPDGVFAELPDKNIGLAVEHKFAAPVWIPMKDEGCICRVTAA